METGVLEYALVSTAFVEFLELPDPATITHNPYSFTQKIVPAHVQFLLLLRATPYPKFSISRLRSHMPSFQILRKFPEESRRKEPAGRLEALLNTMKAYGVVCSVLRK